MAFVILSLLLSGFIASLSALPVGAATLPGPWPADVLRFLNPPNTCDAETTPPLINGDELVTHPSVVSFQFTPGFGCTGTVIADRYLLTAAHCVPVKRALETVNGSGFKKIKTAATDFKVVQGNSVTEHFPIETYIPSEYSGDSDFTNDIAIVRFKPPLTQGHGLPLMPLNLQGAQVGEEYTFVGAGHAYVEVDPETKEVRPEGAAARILRQGTNRLTDRFGGAPGLLVFLGDAADTNSAGRNVRAEQGDSGGPMIRNGEIAGIMVARGDLQGKSSQIVEARRPGSELPMPQVSFHALDLSYPSVKAFLESVNRDMGFALTLKP